MWLGNIKKFQIMLVYLCRVYDLRCQIRINLTLDFATSYRFLIWILTCIIWGGEGWKLSPTCSLSRLIFFTISKVSCFMTLPLCELKCKNLRVEQPFKSIAVRIRIKDVLLNFLLFQRLLWSEHTKECHTICSNTIGINDIIIVFHQIFLKTLDYK